MEHLYIASYRIIVSFTYSTMNGKSVLRMPNSRTLVRSAAQAGKRKVALKGASGGVGQPLSLLLKLQYRHVAELPLYDIVDTQRVATDVGHCNTPVQVHTASFATSKQGRLLSVSSCLWITNRYQLAVAVLLGDKSHRTSRSWMQPYR